MVNIPEVLGASLSLNVCCHKLKKTLYKEGGHLGDHPL